MTRTRLRSAMGAAFVLSTFAACRGLIGYEDGFGFPTDGGGSDATLDTSRRGSPGADGASAGDDDGADAGGDAVDASLFALCEGVDAGDGPSSSVSCASLAPTCGPNHDEDCCTTIVLEGGAYPRYGDDDGNYALFKATVNTFALDKFEVTVGRFRAFVQSTTRAPVACSGKNPSNPDDLGWDPGWNGFLPDTPRAFDEALSCAPWPAWTARDDNLPINCVSWYVAQAFCIWDHARLPTLAEWNYAAAGGADRRPYPWGSDAPNASFADFSCDTTSGEGCSYTDPIAQVGSFPDGGAKWGQLDMAGNVAEWVQDGPDPTLDQGKDCKDCAYLGSFTDKITRGGAFDSFDTYLRSVELRFATFSNATVRDDAIGLRCARNP